MPATRHRHDPPRAALDPEIVAQARRRRRRRRVAAALATMTLVSSISTVAYSFWTNPQTTTTAGSMGLGTVTGAVGVALTGAGSLLIGTSQQVTGTLSNSGTTPVHISQVTFAVASVKDSGGVALPSSSCDPTWFSVTSATVNADVPAGGSLPLTSSMGGSFTLTNLPSTNQDGCKLATVMLSATAS
ncbi:hypothetical protein [Lapillicoccus jejuensis]|uniref:Uncharacterized protein n=1 Tax=Lapillicoccus jejuensis TaxID=402171 RepID=A0A542DVY9_9MICO|nr:hypothetical protein [Lapillicoccus jejuensis]TQJ07243.1 hypothetical protein FB458_0301 [Lapillicoccus jejuensis]